MLKCTNCGREYADGSKFCPECGCPAQVPPSPGAANPQTADGAPKMNTPPEGFDAPPPYQAPYQAPLYIVDRFDHTEEFAPEDISQNKVIAMAPYLMGWIGIIIALLSMNNSPYASFHVKQALKLQVVLSLTAIVTGILSWTLIVPIAGVIFCAVLFVVKIIGFFSVCSGKAKELPIIKSFGFLR